MSIDYGYLIIDLGTTKTEIVLYDASVHIVRSASFRTREIFHDGYACIDPLPCMSSIINCIRELNVAGSGIGRLQITVTGMGATLLACTPDGTVRYPSIAWHQSATAPMPQDLPTDRTGKVPIATYPLYKMSALKAAVPDANALFAALPDYVHAALTGFATWRTDRSFASRSMLYSDLDQQWDTGILRALDISEGSLPAVVAAGEVIGAVPPALRRDAHLPQDSVVVAGMHDHVATLYAATRIRDRLGMRVLINAAGTTESVMELVPASAEVVLTAPAARLNTEATWSADALAVSAYPTLSGRVLEFAEAFAVPWDVDASLFNPQLTTVCPMRRLQPHDPGLVAPRNPDAFTMHDLLKSLILSTQYELKTTVADIAAFGAHPAYEAALLLGGQARNSRLCRLKSVVLGLPLYSGVQENFASLGAALFLSDRQASAGDPGSEAAERVASTLTVQYPEPELVQRAAVTYRQYIAALRTDGPVCANPAQRIR